MPPAEGTHRNGLAAGPMPVFGVVGVLSLWTGEDVTIKIHVLERHMNVTTKALRTQAREILDCVERGEPVIITYRGKPRAKLVKIDEERGPSRRPPEVFQFLECGKSASLLLRQAGVQDGESSQETSWGPSMGPRMIRFILETKVDISAILIDGQVPECTGLKRLIAESRQIPALLLRHIHFHHFDGL